MRQIGYLQQRLVQFGPRGGSSMQRRRLGVMRTILGLIAASALRSWFARSVALVLGFALAAVCFASSASAAAPCTTTATGGEWPMYGHDVANTRTQPEASGLGPTALAGLTPAWTFSTSSAGDGTGFNTTPV